MTEPADVLGESGLECPNCTIWRRLCDDYFIEVCPNCGDEEIYIFETEDDLP
jgi:hypothetical protein